MVGRPAGSRDGEGMPSRIVSAAAELFVEHGVHGTSLQMIADRLGVAKAGVYYYFKTKEEIVGEVYAGSLREFYAAIEEAEATEAASTRSEALAGLLPRLVDLAIGSRTQFGMMHADPELIRLTSADEGVAALWRRFERLLTGGRDDASSTVRAAVVTAALYGAAVQPMTTQVDATALRACLAETLLTVVGQ